MKAQSGSSLSAKEGPGDTQRTRVEDLGPPPKRDRLLQRVLAARKRLPQNSSSALTPLR
jgi:hypothetical protein